MTTDNAREILGTLDLSTRPDFFTLPSSKVAELLTYADTAKYRKPRNANGSRGRYFYAYLCRQARRADWKRRTERVANYCDVCEKIILPNTVYCLRDSIPADHLPGGIVAKFPGGFGAIIAHTTCNGEG